VIKEKNIFKDFKAALLILLFLFLCYSSSWFNNSIENNDDSNIIDKTEDNNFNSDDNAENNSKNEYSYNNNIDINNINESDLRKIIDDELFLLVRKKNISELTNQELLRMLINIYSNNGEKNALTTYSPFSASDLKIIHDNSSLNKFDIEFEDIDDFGTLYKYDEITNSYTNLGGGGRLFIDNYCKLVDFEKNDNKYLVSYKCLFSTTHGDGPSDVTLHKNITDALYMKNEIQRVNSEERINGVDYHVVFENYFYNHFYSFGNDLDIYNYEFEIINKKLTLTDFFINDKINNNDIVSGYFEDFLNNDEKDKMKDNKSYQNLKISIADLELVLNCEPASGVHSDNCYGREMLLNGNIVSSSSTLLGVVNTNPYLIITDNFLIIHQNDLYKIDFYDKKGNKLNNIDNVVYSYAREEHSNYYVEKPMYIDDNKLYFLTYEVEDKNNFSYHDYNKICSKYIDLSNNNFKIIDNDNCFNAKISCKEC